MNKKINWWAILAVVIIGIPIGFIAMRMVLPTSTQEKDDTLKVDTTQNLRENKDSLKILTDDSVKQEKAEDIEESQGVINPEQNELSPEQLAEARRQREVRDSLKRVEAARRKMEADIKSAEARRQREVRDSLKRVESERKKMEADKKRAEEKRQREERDSLKRAEAERKKIEAEKKRAEEQRLRDEKARQEAEQKRMQEEQKLKTLLNTLQPIVASGRTNSKIPEGCTVVVNGHDTDYQSFRMGVNYKAYTNVRVTDVKVDAKGVITRIYVIATEQKEDN